jgi:hypothetical protein
MYVECKVQGPGNTKNISLRNLDFRFLQPCLWRIQCHIVRQKSTDVSEEHILSTSRVENYEIKQETSAKQEASKALHSRSACGGRNVT